MLEGIFIIPCPQNKTRLGVVFKVQKLPGFLVYNLFMFYRLRLVYVLVPPYSLNSNKLQMYSLDCEAVLEAKCDLSSQYYPSRFGGCATEHDDIVFKPCTWKLWLDIILYPKQTRMRRYLISNNVTLCLLPLSRIFIVWLTTDEFVSEGVISCRWGTFARCSGPSHSRYGPVVLYIGKKLWRACNSSKWAIELRGGEERRKKEVENLYFFHFFFFFLFPLLFSFFLFFFFFGYYLHEKGVLFFYSPSNQRKFVYW